MQPTTNRRRFLQVGSFALAYFGLGNTSEEVGRRSNFPGPNPGSELENWLLETGKSAIDERIYLQLAKA